MDYLKNNTMVNDLKNNLEIVLEPFSRLQILLMTIFGSYLYFKIYNFYQETEFDRAKITALLFRYFIKLPFIRGIAEEKIGEAEITIRDKCREIYQDSKFITELPKKGLSPDEIFKKFDQYKSLMKIDYKNGRVSGTVYSSLSDDSLKIVKEIYGQTAFSNPLHPDVFPNITKMEAEIIRWVINLYNGDDKCCGTITSGGTESIVLALKAYRDYASNVRGIKKPEIVVPNSAHAAFQKACQYFCIKFRSIPVDPVNFKADIKSMERAINSNTILLVGSACGYPHGTIDDIQALAKLALKYDIPLHVDCCLGGFLVPFLKDAGFPMEPVDFSVPGVTSISADTHKYAFAPKGTSVIMYSDKKYRTHQFAVQTDWPGGIYASPTIAGSRCGANIATCWGTLLYYGYEGYVESTRKILSTQRYLLKELRKIENIFVMGEPKLSVIAIGSKDFDIFRLSGLLTDKGWNLNCLQFPSGFHICLTMMHVSNGVAEDFLNDIKECVKICMKDPEKKVGGVGVVYGMAQSIPDRSMVKELASLYLDSIYDTT